MTVPIASARNIFRRSVASHSAKSTSRIERTTRSDDDDVERLDDGSGRHQPVGRHELDRPEVVRQGDPERRLEAAGEGVRGIR